MVERPQPFTLGRKHFRLYPVTLAKMQLLQRIIPSLEIDPGNLKLNASLEMLRVVQTKREECCLIIAYHTAPNTYKDIFDDRQIKIRKNYFMKEMEEADLATLMTALLTADKTESYMKHLGITYEQERMAKVMKVKRKGDKNTLIFGGKTIFGSFIAPLKEMGYTDNEIRYERPYSYLRLILADKMQTLYLSDDERKKVPISALQAEAPVSVSDPKTKEMIRNMQWD